MKRGYYPRPPAPERFWAMVDKTTAPPHPVHGQCWTWMGFLPRGYGQITVDGRKIGAHVYSWQLANGRPVPERKIVLHKCDRGYCVNPDHLVIGSHWDNSKDMVAKGRGNKGLRLGADGHFHAAVSP